ncbi:MAG: tetratricopeptide repeat protein [Candidatus Gastranaerophilales bacterium]|nr:tetratricopeptide repeat protein [Candidatus Gastranaerophilales bacterium]
MENTTNSIKRVKKVFNINAEKSFREACDLFYLKNYNQSLTLLNKVVELDKTHTKAHLLIGDIRLLHGKDEREALNAYENAIKSNPYSPQAYGSKAYVLDILGKTQEALDSCNLAFENSSKLDDDQLCSLFDQKISLLCTLNRYEEAQTTLETAAKTLPSDNVDYLKSCYMHKINSNRKSKKQSSQTNLRLLF